ncbi:MULTISPECIES: pyridoxine 5'-phosphate synthase [Rhodomicrobium]|uniref:pyridoxine 5'-phosphate synthase n=1 Tax=Rhodomicrobium TaxID=1068 RepID=UPI000B4A7077|nr:MULTISPECIES: pyridoxine 5'-phosphate synthase [Rhodomicrobium]
MPTLRLGVNIDHVATIRNARGIDYPDPLRAAEIAVAAGADGITAHLREDRRHIRDDDISRLKSALTRPLNLEMAATDEMLAIATRHRPNACCLVPERRAELTTEGGLDVAGQLAHLTAYAGALRQAGIRVSLFIDPAAGQIAAAAKAGADIVELHTGRYCEAALENDQVRRQLELDRLIAGAEQAAALGLEVHAGHGLTFDTTPPVAAIPQVVELNIGHFLIAEAIFIGLGPAVAQMKAVMQQARGAA